ncbi:hypothetical protein QR665_17235 [Acinetobacter gerneri]|uniref:hypothetical protein n=1 Tax=Acinetobacter gerneri TaxID=202952 RepID=UPI002936A479|nr:hypothetical protein [Acinetobacter gerneri]MDV2441191.1 hypothetical protein [Acinetobacter gerneri]
MLEQSLEQSFEDTKKIHSLIDEDCEKILENSFLINLSANSLNFAELQLIAKRKNMPYSVFYFESKPNPFHFLGIQP